MKKIVIGLDIGIASVGWAVLQMQKKGEQGKIVDLGVRCFDKAENPKTGEPLNLARRLQRNTRRRLSHRAQRLKQVRYFLQQQGMIESSEPNTLLTPFNAPDPWELRITGLDKKLTDHELARVIYHLVKHRGYYVARKIEEEIANNSDQGRMNQALKVTARLLEDQNYRSVAELIKKENKIKEDRFKENKLGVKLPKRNKGGDYKNTFYRQKLKEELENILKTQQEKGNSKISDQFIRKIVDDFFWYQRPALSGEAILKMLGHCLHEPDEYRAAKHSYSAERFVWLSSLNNLRISEKGEIRKLTEQERLVLIDLPYSQEKITYKTIRKFLKKEVDFPAGSRFIGLNGKTDEELAAAEKKIFFHGRGYHELRKAFSEQRWEEISVNTALLDQLATILTLYKTDEDIEQHLRLRELNEDEISNLLKVSFSAFNNLSLKALTNLLPYLKQGENYYEACQHCGYSNRKNLPKQRYLPPLYRYEFDKISNKTERIPEIKNPVVMRALNQARKVLNALIRRYDSPNEIHIELARDLPKSAEERNKIDKQHEANRKLKELLIEEIRLQIGRQPKSIELLKYRLYKEQDGKCAYSIKEIDIRRLFETGYVEVDHILPYSRSYDDSLNNKVLVLSKQNQNKHNQTPYEYLNGAADSENWRTFVAMVQANPKFSSGKKERLLRKNFNTTAASEFAERNLNDTRYIARYFTQYIRDHLQLTAASGPQQANNNIIPLTGGITSFLRAKWGLIKDREQSDLHHALDACVIAVATHALINKISNYMKCDEENNKTINKRDFPQPWPFFREELLARLDADPKTKINPQHYSESELNQIKPVFVSRMPKRRNGGALHQETIRSAKFLKNQQSAVRKPLTNLKLADLDKIVGHFLADGKTPDPRNQPLIQGLKARLQAYQGNAKKAFVEPFYKPDQTGNPTQLVRTVKVLEVQKGGVEIRGGIADHDSMYRVDVFEKKGKYYLVPIYQIDRQLNRPLPNKAAISGKNREDWVEMDETYHFKFSLCSNDVVYLKRKKDEYIGYFVGLNVSSASITIRSHDRNSQLGKKGEWEGLGVIRGIEKFEKFHVDLLGNCYPAKKEKRRGMA